MITFLNNFELRVQPESNSANILSAVIELTHCEKLLCELVADAKSTLSYFFRPSYFCIVGPMMTISVRNSTSRAVLFWGI